MVNFMKNRLSLILMVSLLVVLLTGCSNPQAENPLYQEGIPTVPQTNESLKVFCIGDSKGGKLIQVALKLYQQAYPDVEVELIQPITDFQSSGNDQEDIYYEQLSAEIMAGEGPDVLLLSDEFMDVEKLVHQGVFADMEPFFQADHFDWTPYIQSVMDAGVWDSKRFVIPLSYEFPLLCTTKEALEETGFHVEACKSFQGFLDETTRYMEDSTQTRRLFSDAQVPNHLFLLFKQSGISCLDYNKQTVNLPPQLQSTSQWYKAIVNTHPWETNTSLVGGAAAVRDGEALWTTSIYGANFDLFGTAGALRTIGDVVMMPIRDMDGGIQVKIDYPVAVRANSENLQNAYNFLKILLSEKVQAADRTKFSILRAINESYLRSEQILLVREGTEGFCSINHPGSAVDDPSPDEIQQILDFIEEISGGYYLDEMEPFALMMPYWYQGKDYGETLQRVQSILNIYITE